jgi:regulator of CtrA degradation
LTGYIGERRAGFKTRRSARTAVAVANRARDGQIGDMKTETPEATFASTAFFGRTYHEALDLTRETRDYLAQEGRAETSRLAPHAILAFAEESMRMTTRLTQAMAWLLAQRAVHQGELSPAELAEPQWRLGGRSVCLAGPVPASADLPGRFRDLMARSEQIYRRVARLDDMVAREAL